jgi:hypothetical protein
MEGSSALMSLDWSETAALFVGFGGEPISLTIPRTGLPFFDSLRLYGAIDLYVGMRGDIEISDGGSNWNVRAHRRANRLNGRDKLVFATIWKKKKPDKDTYCSDLFRALTDGRTLSNDPPFNQLSLGRLDRSLQAGIRGVAAADYETLKSAQTSNKTCIAEVPLSEAMLASAGRKRVLRLGDLYFLPIFEGAVDLSKVVNPLRLSVTVPNVTCAQALAILSLATSLFAEGYKAHLSAVAFETNFPGQRSDNYSGIVSLGSTALRRSTPGDFIERLYRGFRDLVRSSWTRRGRDYEASPFANDALSAAQWLLQPAAKHLDAMVTSQEKMHRERREHFLQRAEDVREVFNMSYPGWKGNQEAVRKFARAVASGIYQARMAEELRPEKPGSLDDKWKAARKAWYDEVTILRSAPKETAFFERALILIEQGHREHGDVGTARRDEAFDPAALLASLNDDNFETFKILFRMFLVQESTVRSGGHPDVLDDTSQDAGEQE